METKIHLEKTGDRLTLHAPDDPELDRRAKELGGKRHGGSWTFAPKKEDEVRELAQSLFGTNGADGGPKVTLRVDLGLFGEGSVGHEGEAWLAGRLLARRPAFDQKVELGPGVKLVRGGFGVWGGSAQHPAIDARFGTVLDIDGVPKTAAELAAQRFPIQVAVATGGKDVVVGVWSRTVKTRQAKGQRPVEVPSESPAIARADRAAHALQRAERHAAKTMKAATEAAAATATKAAKAAVASRPAAPAKAAAKSVARKAKVAAKSVTAKAKATGRKVRAKAKTVAKQVRAKAKSVARKARPKARAVAKKVTKVAKRVKARAVKAVKRVKARVKARAAKPRAAKKTTRRAGKKRGGRR